jgi:hypothetical protein
MLSHHRQLSRRDSWVKPTIRRLGLVVECHARIDQVHRAGHS